ncbi:unnamed protein product [Ceutorhynchus assimilis]|uniref:Uncharacterized protein n=1 Tax=Ceutorhynchus assimilis TaxID=467358 RepID=A0A9N9MGI7_9CUCU|nr:unnamed protein product [Ceutorhynchus assimilis]
MVDIVNSTRVFAQGQVWMPHKSKSEYKWPNTAWFSKRKNILNIEKF